MRIVWPAAFLFGTALMGCTHQTIKSEENAEDVDYRVQRLCERSGDNAGIDVERISRVGGWSRGEVERLAEKCLGTRIGSEIGEAIVKVENGGRRFRTIFFDYGVLVLTEEIDSEGPSLVSSFRFWPYRIVEGVTEVCASVPVSPQAGRVTSVTLSGRTYYVAGNVVCSEAKVASLRGAGPTDASIACETGTKPVR